VILKKKQVLAAILFVTAIVLSSTVYFSTQNTDAGKTDSITIGLYPTEFTSLIYIAKDQQYFSANGLNVTLRNFASGSAAVNAMFNGEVDVATASEFVVVRNALQNSSLLAFGSVSKYLNIYLVARTDKGISHVSDLEGKKIGVTLGTANQFYLGRYLDLNRVNQNKITLVNVTFAETPNALANGTIDAAVTFQPYIDQIQSLLINKILMWQAQSDQFGFFEATCTRNWAAMHPDLIERFLKALVQAEEFNINHKDQAMDIVARNLNYTSYYTVAVWPDYQYSVTLDQSFILIMQDEARWLINNNLTNETSVPNFLNHIYADGLKSVKPDSVNIIGMGNGK
jgi:NitT/TauT family transport system substrate-binding protein